MATSVDNAVDTAETDAAQGEITLVPIFHPDFDTLDGVVLQSSDDICFSFNGHLLAFLSPVFADLFKIPPPPNITHNPVPIALRADSLALCLTLIKEGMNHRNKKEIKWPKTRVLSALIEFVDAYDMPFVADELLVRTFVEPNQVQSVDEAAKGAGATSFDRFAFACATTSPYIAKELTATLRFKHSDMTKWCEATLMKYDPIGLAELYKSHLDRRAVPVDYPRAPPPTKRRR
ncbi:hypothetical protein Q8F55_006081 [Vanrija albida]|uniref:BTB domain-containing protein n=1 Tax=Vanrija albida TaxID=181172 RepID=A0ABR3Q4F2_9TREE